MSERRNAGREEKRRADRDVMDSNESTHLIGRLVQLFTVDVECHNALEAARPQGEERIGADQHQRESRSSSNHDLITDREN